MPSFYRNAFYLGGAFGAVVNVVTLVVVCIVQPYILL